MADNPPVETPTPQQPQQPPQQPAAVETPSPAPAPARPAPAPIAQPAGEARQGVPGAGRQRSLIAGDARDSLRSGLARRRPATPADVADVLQSAQDAPASPEPAPAEGAASPPGEAAPAPAPAAAPATDGASAGTPAPAPPGESGVAAEDGGQGQAPPPAPTPTVPDRPQAAPAETPPAPAAPPGLHERYRTPEYLARYEADPLLQREVRGIWGQSDLSEVDRHDRILKRVTASERRAEERQTQLSQPAQYLREGRMDEARQAQQALDEQGAQERQYAEQVTRLLAQSLLVEPDDEAFLQAGQGQTPEERLQAFAEWAVAQSPAGRTHVRAQVDARDADWQQRWDTRETEHQAALKALKEQLTQEGEATAAEREAQARAGIPAPPAAGQSLPAGSNGPPSWQPVNARNIRANLSDGYRRNANARN